jgi:hypothetical protein
MSRMKCVVRIPILVILLLTIGGLPASAQFLSGIEGTVKDQSGALVTGAKVTVTDNRLGASRGATTEDGFFRIDSIAASTYTVEIVMSGFKTWEQKDLVVEVGQIQTITPVMALASTVAEVNVSAPEETVNLVSPTTESVIAETTVEETPLSGQNVYGLTALAPGITGIGTVGQSNGYKPDNFTNEYAININAAGLRQEQNGYEIDGAQTNTPSRGGGTSISPNPEIVQTMEVKTNDFDAQKGRNGGATVDVFTVSGSNAYHGSIDYEYTNNALTSLTQQQINSNSTLPPSKRNEIAGAVGGPIIKNKLFWFASVDVLRSTITNSGTATVETQDFFNYVKANFPNSLAYKAMTLAPPVAYATASSPGVKTVSQITDSLFPIPAGISPSLDVIGQINFTNPAIKNGYQWSFRVDDYLGKNDRISVDAIRTWDDSGTTNSRPAFDAPSTNSSDFVNLNWTHTFSPSLLNEAGANMIRPYGQNGASSAFQVPNVNIGDGVAGFGNWGPGNFTQTTVGWRDVMTATVRKHTLKFGFEQDNIRENDAQSGANDRPTYGFGSILDFIQDEAHTDSGPPVNLTTHLEAPYERQYRELYTGVFLQDDWKVTQRFTLNTGVRYDQMNNLFAILLPPLANFVPGRGTNLLSQVAGGTVGLNGTNQVLDHNVGGFTPRVGFAWDLFGNGKTAIRGGVGLFNDQPPYLHITDITANNLPNSYNPSLTSTPGHPLPWELCQPPSGFTQSCPVLPTNNVTINPTTGALFVNGVLTPAGLGGYSTNFKMTQVIDWTLSVQQQLQKDLILEVNFSASAAHHLPIFNGDINRQAGSLIANNDVLVRPNPNFGAINYATSDGNSIGEYGSVSLTRRFSHGTAFRAIYTYGNSEDTLSTSASLDSGAVTSTNQSGPVIENGNLPYQRGRSDFDIRQQFSMDGTYETSSHYNSALARDLLGGWELAGVWVMQSGLPVTVYNGASFNPVCAGNAGGSCFSGTGAFIPGSIITGDSGGDYNADGTNYDLPNTPSFGNHNPSGAKISFTTPMFLPSAFPTPALGMEGNLGRNTFRNENLINVNFTFGKSFSLPWFAGDKMKFEARGEVLNLFNRVNASGLDGNMNDGTFGEATGQFQTRQLQMHLKATF